MKATTIILAALGGAFLLLGKESSASALPGGQSFQLTGPSGKIWRVERHKTIGNMVVYDVVATKLSFGPHEEFGVLRFTETNNDPKTREVVRISESALPFAVQTAIKDLGLTQVERKLPAAKEPFKVVASSGRRYTVNFLKIVGGTKFYQVYRGGKYIMTYRQDGSDPSTRRFIASPPNVDDVILKETRSDFGANKDFKPAQSMTLGLTKGETLVKPGRYAANVVIDFPLSLFASAAKIVSKITDAGFTNVTASSSKPTNWPSKSNADWYVLGTWVDGPKAMKLPSQLKKVSKVPDGFQRTFN